MNTLHALAPLALLLAACGGDAPASSKRAPTGEQVEVRVFSARPVAPDVEVELADRLEVVSAGDVEPCPEATAWCTDGDPGRCCESDFGVICYDCARPGPEQRARRFEVEVVDASTGTVREDLRVRLTPRDGRPTLPARQ